MGRHISVTLIMLFLVGCGNVAPASIDGALAPDFTLPDGNGNMVHLADELNNNQMVVLVFYSRYTWGFCLKQLGGLEYDRAKFEEEGVQIIAIAVQPEKEAALTGQLSRAQYPILADNDHAVAEAYGVYNLPPGEKGEATPAVFIINQDRQVIWESIPENSEERVPSETILENLPR